MKISGKDGKVLYGAAITITNADHADGVITISATAHGLLAKQRIFISGVVGMTDINGSWTIASAATDTFTFAKSTSQTYTSGGTARKKLEITSWSMEDTGEVAPAPDSSNTTYMDHVAGGLLSKSGSIEVLRHTGVLNPPLLTLMDAVLYENSGLTHTGQLWLTSRSIGPVSIPGAEAVKIGYKFTATGEWTEADSN